MDRGQRPPPPQGRDNPRSRPVARAVWTSNDAPADDANGSVPAIISGGGAGPTRRPRLPRARPLGLVFTYGVPLLAADIWTLDKPRFPARTGTYVHTGPSAPACHPTR